MDTTSNENKTQGPEIEEVVLVKSGKPGSSVGPSKKQPDKEKSHKSKNIHLSEIKSIIHDMFTNWEISNSELSIDKYFKELCECIRETYLAYISPKKIKKMYEDDLLEVIETEIINELGESFQMLKLENIPHDKLYLYFNSSLFLLITSENEGSPNVVREAIATNLPIVSVDVGDISEYINKMKKSILIEKYNSCKAIEKIKKNIENFGTREDSRGKFEQLISYQSTSQSMYELYSKL